MENINEDYLNLIVKHLRAETSAFEENLLKEWLNESEQNRTTYQETEFLWKAGKTGLHHTPDVENAWRKVKAKTQLGNATSESYSAGGKVRPMYDAWTYLKVAASLLLFIGVGYMARTLWMGTDKLVQLSSGDQKKEVFLPDSSRVWLNKNTTLTYSENYNEKDRNVTLEGEAFFEVKKDKEKPFIVSGKVSRTQVLGTSFNVRSLKNEASDEIKVIEGKVSFAYMKEQKQEEVLLLAGDKAVTQENGKIEKTKIQDENFLSWQSDKLAFDNTPLQEVVTDLENYFNVPVIIQNPDLHTCKFTGTFTKPQIEEIMKVLSVSINLSYSKKDKAYLLTGKGCE
jgi:transmembrane sensor